MIRTRERVPAVGRLLWSIFLTIFLGMNPACTARKGEDGVVTIDGQTFSTEEFFSNVPESRFKGLNTSNRRKVVEEFARRRIILMETEKRGLDRDERIMNRLRALRESAVVDRVIDEEVWEPLLSDSSLRLLYERRGREVGVQHIIITYKNSLRSKSDRSEDEALTLIQSIRGRIEKGEIVFGEAAQEFSEDPSAHEGGTLGYFRWGELFEPVQTVAFSLPMRQVSEPVRSDFGYHVIRVVGMKTVPQPPFEEEIPKLKRFILSGRGHESEMALHRLEKKLSSLYSIHFNDETLEVLLRDIVRVHEGLEGSPKAEDISFVDVKGIVCTVDGEPFDVDWFKERVTSLGKLLSQSVIFSMGSLKTTLEHVMYRYLTERYAAKNRSEDWHNDVERRTRQKRVQILRDALLEELSKENPETSKQELIEALVAKHTVDVNDHFLLEYPGGQDSV
ncbi:MAG: peptidylprolyl isomerase [Fidelibacterota bacterium]